MTIRDAADRWARIWERAWNEKDIEAILGLYSDAVVYSAEPFRKPYRGLDGMRQFVTAAFATEERVDAVFGPPIVGEAAAAVPWWATLLEDGEEATLAGTSSLRFDSDGLVVEQWDTWHQSPGAIEVPGWPF
jgi:hypothetical protein